MRLFVLVAVSTLFIAGSALAQPDTSIRWIAFQGGRPVDVYVPTPKSNDLLATGLTMSQAAIAAYETTATGRTLEAMAAHYSVRRFVSGQFNTQVLYLEDNRALVVAVRGSQEAPDWILDLSQTATLGAALRVHLGFYAAANAVLDDVKVQADTAVARGKQVWITGHSLGGALAQLLAFRLRRANIPIAGVHTFGSPAVGDINWAQAYDALLRSKTHRWSNEDDPMTCYPAVQQSWQQAGRQHVISSTGGAVRFDSTMSTCVDTFPNLTRICEPKTWWGKALSWLTGSVPVCKAADPVIGIYNIVQNLTTNQFSQHGSAVYQQRIGEQLPQGVARGLVRP